MKSINNVRKIDCIGRIVIPAELRWIFKNYRKKDIEISVNSNVIYVIRHVQRCFFCRSTENIIRYKTLNICLECKKDMLNSLQIN